MSWRPSHGMHLDNMLSQALERRGCASVRYSYYLAKRLFTMALELIPEIYLTLILLLVQKSLAIN